MKNITILGTSHIARESILKIKEAFKSNPDLVCVELDAQRFQAMVTGQKPSFKLSNIRHVGVQGFFLAIIGHFLQKKLGSVVGVEPGADMMAAVKEAAKTKTKTYFIDQHINITLKRFSKAFTWKEKFRIIWEIISSPFRKSQKTKLKINLSKIPKKELVTYVIKQLKKNYPSLYKVLVHERNVHMAKVVKYIRKQHPDERILVVVGIGHEEGLRKLLKTTSAQTI